MMYQLKALLSERAVEWKLPAAGEWNCLFHNNYQPHYSTLNLLWFRGRSRFPNVVTKVFREPQVPRQEFQNLQQAYMCAPTCVPRPLHFGLQGGVWMLWMEGVPGLRLQAQECSSGAVLRSLVELAAGLHEVLRKGEPTIDPDRYRKMVSDPLRILAEFRDSEPVRKGCDDLAAQASTDWLRSLPVIPQHGDLCISNILSYRGRWHVIDWESFSAVDLPAYDLITLLISLLAASGETPGQWNPSTTKEVSALMQLYTSRLHLSASDLSLLLPLTLVNWFHLHWSDGRKEFTVRMYKTIQHYFENRRLWESIFLPAPNR